MQLHNVQQVHKNKTKKRVGRGGKRGKTSGRGHKGQKAHGGHGIRPEERDAIKKLPKLRGHGKNRARTVNSSVVKPVPVNLSTLENMFESGEKVSPKILVNRSIVRHSKGRNPSVKILGSGALSKKLIVSGCNFSKKAQELIEKAGGSIV